MSYLRTTSYSGIGATIAVITALALLSRHERRSAVQPLKATTHVIVGARRASQPRADLPQIASGLLINTGAAFFWSAIFTCLLPPRHRRTVPAVVSRALLTVLVAALVDYGLLPRRLRPGWELVLSPLSVAAGLLAMGTGLAAGALSADVVDGPESQA